MTTIDDAHWIDQKRFWRTSEFLERGLDLRAVGELASSGRVIRVRRGCWTGRTRWNALTHEERALEYVLAHAHAAAPQTSGRLVYSHTSAALLHGLALVQPDPLVHVVQDFRAGSKSEDVQRHFVSQPIADPQFLLGVPCTSLARTVVDCACMLPLGPAVALADQALRLGTTATEVDDVLSARPRVTGIGRARKAVELADARSESVGESLTRVALHRLNIEAPVPQFEVRTRAGRHRLDFAWPDIKLALEFDGNVKYYGDEPTADVLLRERKRERALQEEGWTFIRLEWRDLFNDAALKARMTRAIASARRRRESAA